jgi:hypothetical protein
MVYPQGDFRLGIARRPASVPPSLANRLPLSRAINASRPSRTREVFSLTPVSRDALSSISSSMFIVVLMCITYVWNMHICQVGSAGLHRWKRGGADPWPRTFAISRGNRGFSSIRHHRGDGTISSRRPRGSAKAVNEETCPVS